MPETVYVVLAAGTASRMGFAKAFEPLHGRSPLQRIVAALGARTTIIVTSEEHRAAAESVAPDACVVLNNEPERGMSHSLRLGLAQVAPSSAFGVVLADMPYLQASLVKALEALLQADVDVVYPVDDSGFGGHPVLFSARARAIVEALPDGDTLRQARDNGALRRRRLRASDRGAFTDLDEPAQWKAAGDA